MAGEGHMVELELPVSKEEQEVMGFMVREVEVEVVVGHLQLRLQGEQEETDL
jgi:hypothetical protein